MTVTKVLTNYYEDQQKPGRKTKPIYWTNSLFLSEKSMIPSYTFYAKQSHFENRPNGHKQCINKRLQPNGHLVSWEKTKPNKANLFFEKFIQIDR